MKVSMGLEDEAFLRMMLGSRLMTFEKIGGKR